MKKGKILGLFLIPTLLMTGCIDAMPELTEEQSAIIAEYSASLLLKYSPNFEYRIADEEELLEAMSVETTESADIENSEEISTDIQEELPDKVEETQDVEATDSTEESSEISTEDMMDNIDADIAQLLQIDKVSMKYTSYEICNSYPQDSAGFSVSAAQGKNLLVIHLDIENITEENVQCDLFEQKLNISLKVNGDSVKALNTMLPNEIQSYIDTIEAGEVNSVVAVAEIDEISDDEITNLVFEISNTNGGARLKLK